MTTTPQLGITHLVEGQGSAETTVNDAVNKMDAHIHLTVIDRDLTSPPGSPTEGDRYIVGASATGDWSGHDGEIAVYLSGWQFFTPAQGWLCEVVDETLTLRYDGSNWKGQRVVTSSITAYAGGGQTNATQMGYGLNIVSTVATANDSVKLPVAVDGSHCQVFNTTGTAAKIFPQSGESINVLSANAGQTLGTTRGQSYTAYDGTWYQC